MYTGLPELQPPRGKRNPQEGHPKANVLRQPITTNPHLLLEIVCLESHGIVWGKNYGWKKARGGASKRVVNFLKRNFGEFGKCQPPSQDIIFK